jgi:hypothetical protein
MTSLRNIATRKEMIVYMKCQVFGVTSEYGRESYSDGAHIASGMRLSVHCLL